MKRFCRISFMLLLACVWYGVGLAHKVEPTSVGAYWSGSLTAGSEVTFSGAGSSDNDTQDGGYVPRWHWDFDYQGTFVEDANTVSSLVSHIYAQGGAYTVAVRYDDNDNQAGNVYTFGVRIYEPKRYYYLKDHLGSIRSTVKGGELLVADDFSGDLSKWTVTSGSGFAIEGGELSCSTSGANTLVNSSSKLLTDGIITVDVKSVGGSSHDPNVIVRYQDPNNFYFVRPIGGVIQIYERLGGSYYNRASGALDSVIESDRFYRLQIVVEGSTISAYWKNGTTPIVTWTDGTPWLGGKVGFFGFGGRHAHWDNMTVTTGGPGQVVVAENFDAWGQVLEGQSLNQGMSDTRYKYTGKERDVESQYDYFGARYYDARIGRWLTVDPLVAKYAGLSPYHYCADNPVGTVDVDGKDFRIKGKSSQLDLLSLVGVDNMQYVTVGQEGMVIPSKGFDRTANAGSQLVSDLCASKELFTYETENKTSVKLQGSDKPVEVPVTGGNALDNVCSAVSGGMQNDVGGKVNYAPLEGAAQVTINPDYQFKTSGGSLVHRSHIVFHELLEVYIMVTEGEPRYTKGGDKSAHDEAGKKGKKRAEDENLPQEGADGNL